MRVKAKCHASAGFKSYVISLSIMQGSLKWISKSWWGNFPAYRRGGEAVPGGNVNVVLRQALGAPE